VWNSNNTNQITDTTAVSTQVTPLHAHHQRAEQRSSHYTIQFQPDMPEDILPHPILVGFQNFESGTSLAPITKF